MKRQNKIVTTTYQVQVEGLQPCKLAMISDLHERSGEGALEILEREQPDLILVAGDILERCTEGESEHTQEEMNGYQGIVKNGSLKYRMIRTLLHAGDFLHVRDQVFDQGWEFLKRASKIAPLYYGVGNHEWYFYPQDRILFQEYGITLLDNADVTCQFLSKKTGGEQQVQIGGLSTCYDMEWLKAFAQKEGPKILISHHPEYYLRYVRGTELDVFGLILSGHVHGGQWRIFGKSVLAPGQGMFPGYGYGFFDGKLVIGSGLANTPSVPRLGNPMEVVILDVQ